MGDPLGRGLWEAWVGDAWDRIGGSIARGVGIAARSGATPFLLGLRWASPPGGEADAELPAAPRSLRLTSKMALDEFFFASEVASAPLVSWADRERVLREMDDALELYEARGFLSAPASYHRTPPRPRALRIARRRSIFGPYEHLSLESEWRPWPGEPGRERWLAYTPNRLAHAWLLRHPGARRPWLVCVPGYRMGHPAVDFTGFQARWLHHALRLNVAIPVLPFHGPRRVGRRGGDGFFAGDVLDTIHAQAQAVWDVRRLVGWLLSRGTSGVGLYGVSLGGLTAALVASVESRLDCVIAGIPAADFLRLVRSHAPDFVLRAAEHVGVRLGDLERLVSVVSPLAMRPRVPFERRFLYAGVADRLASPDHALALWRHWDRPRLHWYEGSHVSFLWEPEAKALIREALGKSGLLATRRGRPGRAAA
jgi:hypothetical protein